MEFTPDSSANRQPRGASGALLNDALAIFKFLPSR
jgi:hypothetical protein